MTDDGNESAKDLRDRFESQLAEIKTANEEAKKNATEATQRADAAERELAFAKTGIDLSDAKAQYFVKGYDGELEPEKIKAAWTAAFGEAKSEPAAPAPPQPGQQDQQLQSEYGQLTAMNQVTSGAQLPTQQDQAGIIEGMDRVLREGGSTEQLAAFMRANGLPVAEGF